MTSAKIRLYMYVFFLRFRNSKSLRHRNSSDSRNNGHQPSQSLQCTSFQCPTSRNSGCTVLSAKSHCNLSAAKYITEKNVRGVSFGCIPFRNLCFKNNPNAKLIVQILNRFCICLKDITRSLLRFSITQLVE